MSRRILAILEARLRAHLGGEVFPFAALLAQGSLVGALALMVRSGLGAWGYAVFTLAAAAGLVLLTLLGEFGSLLRSDPAASWSEALPASALEQRLGRALAVLVLLGMLGAGALLPAALLAPESLDGGARVALLGAGLCQALALGSALLVLQAVLGERIEAALVLLQTGLVVGAVTGLLAAPGLAPAMQALEAGSRPWPELLGLAPSAWFASLVGPAPSAASLPGPPLVLGGTALALLLLVAVPPGRGGHGRKRSSLLSRLLQPAHALAIRSWVRPEERGVFELVSDQLPRERDFVLRTYPMIGIPLAFLVAGADGARGEGLRDLLALLLFSPAVYLPVLLAHVPVSSSPHARHLLETAPLPRAVIDEATLKAFALRFLLPLHLVLGLLAAYLAGPLFALRLALPGMLLTWISLRLLYPRCVLDLPLSRAAEDIEVRHDWMGFLLTLAVGLTVLAVAAQRVLTDLPRAGALVAALALVAWTLGRRPRTA